MVVENAVPITPWERVTRTARALVHQFGPVVGIGRSALYGHEVWRSAVAEGAGVGVVVVPGFGGIDASMGVLCRWLERRGYATTGAGLGMNMGCTEALVERLVRRVDEHARATGGPVVLLGHSRGGMLCRLVAVQRPDLVRALVTLGSPVLNPLDVKGLASVALPWVLRASALGVPGLADRACVEGPCRDSTAAGLAAALVMPALAFYSRVDGVVGWESCRDPHADWVEVSSSHTGLGIDPDVFAALAPRLAVWAAERHDSDTSDTTDAA
ncbi:esterase/lipase family protein [Pseudonocardia sp. GCM10023141]|uniref:esterase/lipase family protein n=1 Tax=Pseudonocardia sp. GCM10023141 TaxID=3252653 RepID=UPI003607804B